MASNVDASLQEKAVKEAVVHVKSMLKGDIAIERMEAEQSWDEGELREILTQPMRLWYSYGDFDVFLNAKNEAVGYFDKSKMGATEYRELPQAEILQLAVATGFVGKEGRVLSTRKGPEGILEAVVVKEGTKADAPRLVVWIDANEKRVIAIVPEGVTP